MKKEKIFFHPIDGSGSLTISWSSGPKGDALEAKQGNGVGFFSESGDLLAVIFDEVQSNKDEQTLKFDRAVVKISVKNGKVAYAVSRNQTPAIRARKDRRSKRKNNPSLRKKRPLTSIR